MTKDLLHVHLNMILNLVTKDLLHVQLNMILNLVTKDLLHVQLDVDWVTVCVTVTYHTAFN